jgi:hypothetical protein
MLAIQAIDLADLAIAFAATEGGSLDYLSADVRTK